MALMVVPLTNASMVRTPTSNTNCVNGVCSLELYSGIVNYDDGSGLVPINDTIVNSSKILYEFMVETGEYQAYFKDSLNTAETVLFVKDGVKTSFQPIQLYWTNSLGQIQIIGLPSTGTATPDGNMMNYSNAFGEGIDLTYHYYNDNLKEELHITNRSALGNPASYILASGDVELAMDYVVVTDGDIFIDGEKWDKKTSRYTNNSVTIRNTDGNVTYNLKEVIGYDNEYNTSTGSYTFKKQGNKLYVTTKIGYYFIENYTYPLNIDPTISLNYSNVSLYEDSYIESNDVNGNNGNLGLISVIATSSINLHGMIKLNHSFLPSGIVINEANLTLYAYVNNLDIAEEGFIVHTYNMSPNWYESNITYANSPPHTGTYTDSYTFFGGAGEPDDIWIDFDVTSILNTSVTNGLTESSVFLFTSNVSGTPAQYDNVYFASSEHTVISAIYRPRWTIVYSTAGEPPASNETFYIDCSTNPVMNESKIYNSSYYINGTGGVIEVLHNITWEYAVGVPKGCKVAVKKGFGHWGVTK